jgi:hypothetical protein
MLGDVVDRRTNDDQFSPGDSNFQVGGRLRYGTQLLGGSQRDGSAPDSHDIPSQIPFAQCQSYRASNQANSNDRHGVPGLHPHLSA